MGYAKNIGRLGALAVVLGVGYGVVDMPLALADGNDSGDSSSSSSSPARTNARGSSTSAGNNSANSAPQRRLASAAARGADNASPADAPADLPVDTSSLPQAAASVKPTRATNSTSPVRDVAANDSSPVAPAPAAAPAAESSTSAAPVAVSSEVVSAPAPAAAAATTPQAAATAPVVTVVQSAAAVGAAQSSLPAIAPRVVATMRSMIAKALAPLLGNGVGDASGQAPLLFTVLAWARKEFERVTGITLPAAVVTSSATQSPNLLVNPGAELSTPSLSGFSSVTMPGWTVTGTPTVIKYDTPRVLMPLGIAGPLPYLPSIWSFPKAKNGPSDGGNQFFGGGNVADSSMSQTVDLSGAAEAIDGGGISYNLGGWLGGYSFDPSATSVKVTFLDSNKTYLGAGSIGPVTALDRLFAINLLERSTTGTLPVGTRYAQVDVTFTDKNPVKIGFAARYNDAYADNLSFTIGADLPAPADPTPPVSNVGALKHIYMVYMENKGYDDILGSPNAPFTNSLINAYGFANNYYALTHGSLPNYYPIIGGDNFGVTWNCATACIDVPKENTLPGQLDAAGLVWRAYAQSLAPGGNPLVSEGEYAFDETGFPAYQFIYDDLAYAKEHIVPLEQMAIDLQSTATAPSYAWFAANEDNNGEGPIDSIGGMIKFALSQIGDHQYNVPALDQYLAETVPVIMNSNAWNSDEASVIVVTFDEDNNNTSLGFGNEGNHIITVVIPNQAAIDSGMRSGNFLATNHYDHYSLLRMIEDSLGLPGQLTQNDKFAPPMNEFWTTGNVGAGSSVV